MSNIELLLDESNSSWFLENYEKFRNNEQIMGIINTSNDSEELNLNYTEQIYIEPILKSIFEFKENIISFNTTCSEFELFLNNFCDSFSLLKRDISGFFFDIDEIKENFTLLKKNDANLRELKEKIHLLLENIIINSEYLRNIMHCTIDTSYIYYLDDLNKKLENINKFCIKNSKIEIELSTIYRALKSIAFNRICQEFIFLFSNNEFYSNKTSLNLNNSKLYSKLLEKGKLLTYLNGTSEFNYLMKMYSNLISNELIAFVFKHIENLLNKRNKNVNVNIVSKEYDKYYLAYSEREQILNKVYLETEDYIEDILINSSENCFCFEESFYYCQKIIYKTFLQIYELSRQFFKNGLNKLISVIFNDYFNKLITLIDKITLKSSDIIGLFIAFNILLKFETFALAKIKVYEFGIEDCEILFKYYSRQSQKIFSCIENSIIFQLELLTSFNNRELTKLITDKMSLYSVTRRAAELLVLIIKLVDSTNKEQEKQFEKLIWKIQQSLAKWLKFTGNYLQYECNSDFDESCIYVINNIDIILSTLKKKDKFSDIFHLILQEYTQKYIESRFKKTYVEINHILESESLKEIEMDEFLHIANYFRNNWKKNFDFELQYTLRSFYNFETSEEILRSLATFTAIKYSRFMCSFCEIKGVQNIEVNQVLVEEILEYVQKCLYPIL